MLERRVKLATMSANEASIIILSEYLPCLFLSLLPYLARLTPVLDYPTSTAIPETLSIRGDRQ